ncbi:MAG: hypothetical protein L0027_10185, partial [Candidatus Rokubacteria bacterium]|nr:hypothetical protein [Candidatus Rokubacteria bacterium]
MTSEIPNPIGDDPEMSRLLRERLPRHPAPAALRAAVVDAIERPAYGRRWGAAWVAPALSALAASLAVFLLLVPRLPTGTGAPDSLQLLMHTVVSEHSRMLLWAKPHALEVVSARLPEAMEESGIPLAWVFTRDDDLRLVKAEPTWIEGHRALALAYTDQAGHVVTYLLMPGHVELPERGRVQIDRWRPLVHRSAGFSLIVWRQQGLICVLVSDLVSDADLERFKQYFVKLRSAT